MAYLTEAEDKLAEYMNANVTEPTRIGQSGRLIPDSTTLAAAGSQQVFTFASTREPVCINYVTQNNATLKKYSQYGIDLRNKRIQFVTPATVSDAVVINYSYGTAWIYADLPRIDLTKESYPRIGIDRLSTNSVKLGTSDTVLWEEIRFQFDHVVADDVGYVFEVGKTLYGNEAVKALKKFTETAIEVTYYNTAPANLQYIKPVAKNPVPFDEPNSRFRYIIEYIFKEFNRHN